MIRVRQSDRAVARVLRRPQSLRKTFVSTLLQLSSQLFCKATHSLKNELILGRRVHRESRQAKVKLDALLKDAAIRPKLVRLLEQGQAPSASVMTERNAR